MTWYYSASERSFFTTDLMTTGSMPSDRVAVADDVYEQLMADQVAGKLIRPGSGNVPESANQNLTAASRFGDVSFGKVTCTALDLNGAADISGTLVVGGTTTLKGALAAQAGITTTTITATGTTTLAALNATNITASGTLKVNGQSTLAAVSATNVSASGTLTVNGNSTLKALSATNISASGTLKVTGASTLTGKLTANGGLDTKAITATTLTTSGNATIGGLLAVTGATDLGGSLTVDGTVTLNADAVYWKGNQTNAYRVFRRMTGYGSDSYGDNFVIGGMNQLTFLCSGEIGKALNDDDLVALAEGSEDLVLVSDNAIVMAVGGNGDDFDGMKRAVFSSIGDLSLPAKLTTAGDITTSGGVTASGAISGGSFSTTGNLTCNAVTASGNLTAQNIISKTGYIGVQTANKTYWPIAVVDLDESGGFCGYRGFGGMTAIGSGESATTLQANVETEFGMSFGSENLFVCSDQGIWLLPECNTWANHGTIQVQNNGIYKRLMNRTRGDGDTTISFLQSFLCDKTGNGTTSRYAGFEANTREGTQAIMMAYDPRDSSNSTFASIQVRYSSDGVISTLAPTPPTGDRSTQIATTACFDNEGFVGRKTLTSIKSVMGCFWFDSLSGLNIDDNGLDFVLNADWYGLQLGMFNGQDKSQYVFNSGSIWRRYSDSAFGDETWSDWVQIADGTGLIAMKTETPAASDSSTRIASTKWVMDHLSSAIPPGAVMFFAQGSLPDGWLICNGANVSRTTYANLFAAIGTKYGSGNGSSTFTLPNLNAKFIEGTTTTSSVGQTVSAGLPNITGSMTGYEFAGSIWGAGALFEDTENIFNLRRDKGVSGNNGTSPIQGFDASKSNSIYGSSTTVQPPAIRLLPCIKY